ncbi:GGDEF domain-containing protein [Cohaesibacter haloalkalitolerans]|uniref:GGDEF domain-containing protein n=1 Tax=Cohaesibacter haloalkalitolerans TaxID=1162980 RepID=UPI000E649052|nr:GGDEF domain-containing protein [Cohaesibacter haloalkalitolerans]
MPNELDLATVLLLQKTAYIVGAATFVYLWFTSSHLPALIYLTLGFLLMAFGSTLAGMGEWASIPQSIWQMGSLVCGLWGYTFIWLGFRTLSKRGASARDLLAFTPTTLLIVIAMMTHFEQVNAYRAATFNLVAAMAFLASAVQFMIDYKDEPLRSRYMIAAVSGIAGLLCLNAAVGFLNPQLFILDPLTVFYYVIVLNFILVVFTVVLLSDRAHTSLQRQAHTDHLTGVSNRRSFFMQFAGTPATEDALLLLDLDHFKRVNDRFGHVAGDVVLQVIALRIKSCLRPDDVLARYGGEEFIALLPRAGLQEANIMCERIRHAICHEPVIVRDQQIHVSASIGAAVASDADGTLQQLINAADQKLYQAKEKGRNRVELVCTDRAA